MLPKKLTKNDISRDEKTKERDKDEWRVKSDIYFSSTKEMVSKEQAKEIFVPKMTLDVWNDKKVKNKDQLVQGLANKLVENIKCDNNNK